MSQQGGILGEMVQGGLQACNRVLHATNPAEMPSGDFGRTAVAIEGLDFHQIRQCIELKDAALDIAFEQ